MSAQAARHAELRLNDNEHPTMLRVTLPHRISEAELSALTNHIVQNIVRPHTGCTCLSGRISVLLDSVYQEAVQVNL
jgi:hypothetical protein